MKAMRTGAVVMALFLGGIGSLLWADRAPSPPVVSSFSPHPDGKSEVVEMTWEEVDIYPSPDWIRVEVAFGSKNTGPSEVEYEVGFPAFRGETLEDFSVKIDGVQQSTRRKETNKQDRSAKYFPYWICWKERFREGQENTVKVSYRVKPRYSSYRNYDQEGYTAFFPAEMSDARDLLRTYHGRYTLQTGAAWAGNIGKAVFRIHYSDRIKKQ